MRTVLLTGFGDYAGETGNPSGAIAAALDGRRLDGDILIRGRVLPVSTSRVAASIADALDQVRPDVILLTGVAAGRLAPAVERVAVNVRDFPVHDVDDQRPVDEVVCPDGPAAYLSTLPVKAILSRWRTAGIPGYVSNTAGTFLCNQAFYLARHLTRESAIAAGFVHVPAASGQVAASGADSPSLPLGLLRQAVQLAAVTAACHRGPDLPLPAGSFS